METKEVTQITEADFGTTFKLKDTATEAYASIIIDGQVADTFKLFSLPFKITGIVSRSNKRMHFEGEDTRGMKARITIPYGTELEQAD